MKMPFTVATKNKIQYLEINLNKEIKVHCIENYKTLMKEIEDDNKR
jgi:hypothetical protein